MTANPLTAQLVMAGFHNGFKEWQEGCAELRAKAAELKTAIGQDFVADMSIVGATMDLYEPLLAMVGALNVITNDGMLEAMVETSGLIDEMDADPEVTPFPPGVVNRAKRLKLLAQFLLTMDDVVTPLIKAEVMEAIQR